MRAPHNLTDWLSPTVVVGLLRLSDACVVLLAAVVAYLTQNPDTGGILALGPTAAEPTLAALEEMGGVGTVNFGTFDLSETEEFLAARGIDLERYGWRPD